MATLLKSDQFEVSHAVYITQSSLMGLRFRKPSKAWCTHFWPWFCHLGQIFRSYFIIKIWKTIRKERIICVSCFRRQ